MSLAVAPIADGADLAAVRALCRDFRAWLYARYAEERAQIDLFYGPALFEPLLDALPSLHAPPAGAILLARLRGAPVGCAMLARLDAETCEVKRVFVAEGARGRGVARALMAALVETGRAAGYSAMLLDTGPRQTEAQALYEALGFRRIPAYHDPGVFWRGRLIYMEHRLDARPIEADQGAAADPAQGSPGAPPLGEGDPEPC